MPNSFPKLVGTSGIYYLNTDVKSKIRIFLFEHKKDFCISVLPNLVFSTQFLLGCISTNFSTLGSMLYPFCIIVPLQNHTFLKVKILSKNSILTKTQYFHEFFTPIFFENFSREIKVVNS